MSKSEKLRITKTIVDGESYNLIGFVVEGKEKDFGGLTDAVQERPMTLNDLANNNFSNKQISIGFNPNTKVPFIIEGENFKINSLPMLAFTNNGYVPIKSGIVLTQKIMNGTNLVGFTVEFESGRVAKINTGTVARLSRWFKPTNFIIRVNKNGTSSFAMKQGMGSINNLPTINLSDKVSNAKKMKSTAQPTNNSVTMTLPNNFDILDMIETVEGYGAYLIKFDSDKYNAHTDGVTSAEGFIDFHTGETASTRLKFNGTKLNVNADFKKPGVVMAQLSSRKEKLDTFLYRTKSIFVGGKNNMKRIGIAIPVENEQQFVNQFSKSLAIKKVENAEVVTKLSTVLPYDNNYAIYEVNVEKLDLISNDRQSKSILSANKIKELCEAQFLYKSITKCFGARSKFMAGLKEKVSKADVNKIAGKTICSQFSRFNASELAELEQLGFDVFTGAYNPKSTGSDDKASSSKEGASETIEITYTVDGLDPSKWTGDKFEAAVKKGEKFNFEFLGRDVADKLLGMMKSVFDCANPVQQYEAAYKMNKQAEAELTKINKVLWLHIASMYIKGNGVAIHTQDKGDWAVNDKSRVKTGKVYVNKSVTGLCVKVVGIII